MLPGFYIYLFQQTDIDLPNDKLFFINLLLLFTPLACPQLYVNRTTKLNDLEENRNLWPCGHILF